MIWQPDGPGQVPHKVQMVMSSETTPILSGLIPAFEMFMSSWEQLAEKHPRLSQWINIGMAKATEYYTRMDHTSAYIMSMCEHPDLLTTINAWLIVVSSESFHPSELDPEELVSRLHRSRWTEDKDNSK